MRPLELSGRLLSRFGLGRRCPPTPGYKLARLHRAEVLSASWDNLATSYFQRRGFLRYLERHNPCSQRYYELRNSGGELVAAAVVYTLVVDLLTFRGLKSPAPIHFVGIPCSQSAPGLLGSTVHIRCLMERLVLEEPHFLVGLNLEQKLGLDFLVEGSTLPTVIMDHRVSSFEQYSRQLRSPYRRRLKKVLRQFVDASVERGSCSEFDREMYDLYLGVYQRSSAKLEKLSFEFFRNLPPEFVLTTVRQRGSLLGWHISLLDDRHHRVLYFFLEGHSGKSDLYFHILFDVLRLAIEGDAAFCDLGQTSEIAKTRLGGHLVSRGMFATHPNPLLRAALWTTRHLLEYKRDVPQPRVFR